MRNSLLALLLCTGFLSSAVAQFQPALHPSDESARPELSALDKEWNEWSTRLWCGMLDHPIPLVRVRVHHLLQESQEHASPITCSAPLPETSEFLLEAVLTEPDNPALLATVYRLECARRRPADWCRTSDLREKLLVADPDNAFPHLLYLQAVGTAFTGRSLTFSDSELQYLLRAASAKKVDAYWGAGLPEAYEAIESAVLDMPAKDWSMEAQSEFDSLGYDLNNPSHIADFASLNLVALDNTLGPYSMMNIYSACQAAEAAADDIAIEGCQALGELAVKNGRTLLAQKLGQSLQYIGAAEPQDWERRFSAVRMQCMMPKFSIGQPGKMPEGEQLLWLTEQAELGEVVAAQQKAMREYAIDPDAFVLDPARCDELETLNDEQRERVAERVSSEGLTEALEFATRFLNGAE